MTFILWLGLAFAGAAFAPSDGIAATGPRSPAWAIYGAKQTARGDFTLLSGELDKAWAERRSLDNAAAWARVDRVIVALRPTLDAGERDLLQRALFLRGVLDIDDAGGIDAVKDGVVVGGQRVPRAWADAVAVSPGATAPSTADAAFATHIYDQARTALTVAGGLVLDASAPGADEVRVDGLPVTQPITLLSGLHTLSWHPVGADPVVLQVRVGAGEGGYDAVKLKAWLEPLEAVEAGERTLTAAERLEFHQALGSPAVAISTDGPARLHWLVDGAKRWGKPKVGGAIGVGVWAFSSRDAPAVACDGTTSTPSDALVVAGPEISLTSGPVRLRAGGGVVHALGGGFASIADGSCATGIAPNVELIPTVPWAWASVGRRFGLSRTQEIEPFVRVGGTGAHALAQLGANVRLAGKSVGLEARVAAGPAFNAWSDESAHLAFMGGIETVVSIGGR